MKIWGEILPLRYGGGVFVLWILFQFAFQPQVYSASVVFKRPRLVETNVRRGVTPQHKPSCLRALWNGIRKVAGYKVIESEVPMKVFWTTLGTLFYPVKAVAKSLHFVGKLALGKAKIAAPSRSTIVKNALQAGFFSLILLASKASSLPTHYLEEKIPADLPRQAVVVSLNGFEEDDPNQLKALTKDRFDRKLNHLPNAVYYEPSDDVDALETLKAIAEERGPIEVLEVWGHGSPGTILVNGGEMERNRYNAVEGAHKNLFVKHPAAGEPLPTSTDHLTYAETGGDSFMMVRIRNDYRLKEVFAPNAVIIFYGCSTGKGEQGTVFLQYMADVLSDEPLKLYASNVDVVPNYSDVLARQYGLKSVNLPPAADETIDIAAASIRLAGTVYEKLKSGDPHRWKDFLVFDRVTEVEFPGN